LVDISCEKAPTVVSTLVATIRKLTAYSAVSITVPIMLRIRISCPPACSRKSM
jgi:hypothetical protein